MRSLVLQLALALVVMPHGLMAQYPGGAIDGTNRVRARFLSETLQEVSKLFGRYKDALQDDAVDEAIKFFEDEGFYAGVHGESIQGKDDIARHLRTRVGVTRGYRTTTVDFVASGAMAYLYGRFSRLVTDIGTIEVPERGSFVALFYRAGRDWRIRSYVERLDADSP